MSDNNIRFTVDKEKRTVVCKLEDCKYIAIDRIKKYTEYDAYCGRYYIPDTFVGVARCAPEDEWDEEYGKKLALFRAKRKRGIAINNAIWKCLSDMRNEINSLRRYGLHHIPESMDKEDYKYESTEY